METRGRGLVWRICVVLASMTLAAGMFSGAALADDDDETVTGGDSGGSSESSTPSTPGLQIPGVGSGGSGSGVGGGGGPVEDVVDTLTRGGEGLADVVDRVASALTSAIPSPGGSTDTTTGSNTEIIFTPQPIYIKSDKSGHRSYGKYYDRGCGCERFAAPTFVPQVVFATQVAAVPKGGVDTGDGSFQ